MINFVPSPNAGLLQQVQEKQTNLMEKLASGKRVNNASDDAAAQQIIDRLTSQVDGNRQAVNNAYDGISLAQVAEGGLAGIGEDVSRIRELSIQAGSGILNDSDRRAIQSEIAGLQENISLTVEQTNFAGKPLLSEDGAIDFQVSANSGQSVSVDTQNVGSRLSDILNIDVSTTEGANAAIEASDAALEFVGSAQSDLGATQNQFASAARNLTQADVNTAAARSRIQDTDYAQTVSQSVSNDILDQAAMTVQSQANQQQGQVLALLS
ncbi:flagellin [Alteromonas pelagimontana]|uniref:Flagellin n=1 Tax=Alteromonas pelagimontana TaxID=1858656 RepID=A0A6M4MFA0_9ALTE|nr:flagellin [Alteromonas pelagimontana]QJR81851.1 flagellin [Alteromonas pelagimontana]